MALHGAVSQGLMLKFGITDVNNPQQAAATYAQPLVEAGIPAAEASGHMLEAIHNRIAANIDAQHAHTTADDIANAEPEEIHAAYVKGDVELGPLEIAMEQAVPDALKAHASGYKAWLWNMPTAGGRMANRVGKTHSMPIDKTPDGVNIARRLNIRNGPLAGAKLPTKKDAMYGPAPYDLLCVRPFRQYTMGTGVLCKKGNELGNTFRGWADFQLTDNIIAKTHIGHFTFWHASVVTNPKCLFLAEDIFCTNYEAGEGREVLSWSHAEEFREDPIGTMRRHNASIIALPVPVGAISPLDHRLRMNNPISLTGSLDPNVRQLTGRQDACCVHIGNYETDGTSFNILKELHDLYEHKIQHLNSPLVNPAGPGSMNKFKKHNKPVPDPSKDDRFKWASNDNNGCGGQILSDIYDAIWNFSGMNHSVDYQNSGSFETSARLINIMCFHTMQKFQNPHNLRWEVTNLNTGHFGENGIYEGVKKIRCGFLDYFKQMDYQKAMAMGGQNI